MLIHFKHYTRDNITRDLFFSFFFYQHINIVAYMISSYIIDWWQVGFSLFFEINERIKSTQRLINWLLVNKDDILSQTVSVTIWLLDLLSNTRALFCFK